MDSNKAPFGSLNLKKEVVDSLKEHGFEYLSPIQENTIPKLLKCQSVLGLAPTGTGKTLAYAVPIINDLENNQHVQAVILSPTVALLAQIKDVFLSLLEGFGFPNDAVKAVYSNSDFSRSHPLIVLTTPSMYKGVLSKYPVNQLKRMIIDEGDMVAFDGFEENFEYLKGPKNRHQISFFSASLNIQDIKKVMKTFAIQELCDVRDSITNKGVNHHLVSIRGLSKEEALPLFLRFNNPYKSIAFVSSKDDLYVVDESLKDNGIHHLLLHGNLEKRVIGKVIDSFHNDDEPLMIATDYASRGLDIPSVKTIISVDLPEKSEYYFHRAGRAGRFDEVGDSFVFYDDDDKNSVRKVEDLVRRKVSFDIYYLSKNGLRKGKEKYLFKNLGKKDKSNDKLQKQIRHAVEKNRSTKVKPNYKKKVSKAIEDVKLKHRKNVVLTNIARSGGNVRDFHVDKGFKGRKR